MRYTYHLNYLCTTQNSSLNSLNHPSRSSQDTAASKNQQNSPICVLKSNFMPISVGATFAVKRVHRHSTLRNLDIPACITAVPHNASWLGCTEFWGVSWHRTALGEPKMVWKDRRPREDSAMDGRRQSGHWTPWFIWVSSTRAQGTTKQHNKKASLHT